MKYLTTKKQNVIFTVLISILCFVLFHQSGVLDGAGMAALFLNWLPLIIGLMTIVFYLIANAISETLTFSGIEAGSLDVLFLSGKDPMIEKLTSVGLRFDLPEVITAETFTPTAPGRDPEKPPKLT